MAGYLELCVSNDVQPDPLTLFYLTGLARGDCITLLGGDLQQPLTLHAPKSAEELELTNSIKLMEGSPTDKARLLIAGIELDSKARTLLPKPDDDKLKGQLLSARMERKDIYAIYTLAKKNPQVINQLQSAGNLPLARAVNIPSEEMILCMLSLGANINATDCDSDTVLFNAISNNTTDVLKLLLERGANPNCPNYESVTPLLVAIENNKTKAAELLIRYDADITWVDEGDTALTLAVRKGQLSVVNCILRRGVDRRSGLSVELVQQARAAGREDIAGVLEQALPKEPTWKNSTQ
jgi:ankyrin repeat protein